MSAHGNGARAFTLLELLVVVGIISILAAIAIPNFLDAQARAKVARVKSDLRTLNMAIESFVNDHNDLPYAHSFCDDHQVFETRYMGWISFLWQLSTPVAYLSTTMQRDPFIRTLGHTHLPYGDPTVLPQNPRLSQLHVFPEAPPTITAATIYIPPNDLNDPTFTYLYARYDYEDTMDPYSHGFAYYNRGYRTQTRRPKYFLTSVGPDGISGPDIYTRKMWPTLAYVRENEIPQETDYKSNAEEMNNLLLRWQYDPSNGALSSGDIVRYQEQ